MLASVFERTVRDKTLNANVVDNLILICELLSDLKLLSSLSRHSEKTRE